MFPCFDNSFCRKDLHWIGNTLLGAWHSIFNYFIISPDTGDIIETTFRPPYSPGDFFPLQARKKSGITKTAESNFFIEPEGRGIPSCLNTIKIHRAQCRRLKQLCGLSIASLVPIKWFSSKPRMEGCCRTSRRKQQYATCLSMVQLLRTKPAQKTALFHTLGSTLELEEEKRTQRYLE